MNIHEIAEAFKRSFDDEWDLMDAIGLVSPYFPNTFTPSGGHDVVVPAMRNPIPQPIKKFYRIERCFRDIDIGIVGLSHHLSYFEMLTFGIVGYIHHQILEVIEKIVSQMAYILFEVFQLDYTKIFTAYFSGGIIAGVNIPPVTNEEIRIWEKYFKLNLIPVPGRRTFIYAAMENWPAGAGFEIFYDRGSHLPETIRFVEIASINFYKYINGAGSLHEAVNWAIGGGIGLERLAMVIQQAPTIYDIDVFQIIKNILNCKIKHEEIQLFSKAYNIAIDHLRALIFILMDGQKADSTPRGKILRRLAKRTTNQLIYLNLIDDKFIDELCKTIIFAYQSRYPQLVEMRWDILKSLENLIEMRWVSNEV